MLAALCPDAYALKSLQRNVELYRWFRAAADGHAWITVFFLYMNSYLPLHQVIELSALYYLAVFILEVPSGYFSDRVGRRTTLLLAAAGFIASFSCFIIGDNFWWFAAGQAFLAMGMAMQSGTDTAFLYDSLRALGRESEYAAREASAEQWGSIFIAIATLVGGVLALIDLYLAYVYSLLSAMVMFGLAWLFVEPVHADDEQNAQQSFVRVISSCLARLRDSLLAWIFAYVILLYALAHIVYEFYQPYITLLDLQFLDAPTYAPLISGIVISISMFSGAFGARLSIPWQARFGFIGVLAIALFIQLGIVAAMAVAVSPLVLWLVCLRNFPMALAHAPVRAAIAPRITREQRATYLSLQGLSERLVFAALLLGLASGLQPGAPVDEPTLLGILMSTTGLGLVCTVLLLVFVGKIQRALGSDSARA